MKLFNIFSTGLFFFTLLHTPLALAAPGIPEYQPASLVPTFSQYAGGGPFSAQNIVDLTLEARNIILVLAVAIVVIFFVLGVIRLIFTAGDEEKKAAAVGSIAISIIGALLIFATFPLLGTLKNVLTNRSFFGPVSEQSQANVSLQADPLSYRLNDNNLPTLRDDPKLDPFDP